MEKVADFASPGGMQVAQIGNPLTSDTIIYPTHRMHHVTGANLIKSISTRYLSDDFVGPIILLADANWTWDATGNIAALGDAVVVGRAYPFWFDRQTAKWYPIGTITINPS